ncbi:MAG: hypothetical protein WKF36_06210 [Candidatus Nitrosocosmicus sp.]
MNLAFYSKKRESNNELNTLIHKHSDVFTNIQQRKIIMILAVAAVSLLMYNTTTTPSFAQVNNTQGNPSGNVSTSADNETNAQDYILNIRSLLNQTISAYADNDTAKASELATTAYLDNFEHIEEPIGEELSEQGEELLREQLRAQIDSNASIEDIRQTVNAINTVLDDAEESLSP